MQVITVILLVLVLSLSGCPAPSNPCATDYFMLLPSDNIEWSDEKIEV